MGVENFGGFPPDTSFCFATGGCAWQWHTISLFICFSILRIHIRPHTGDFIFKRPEEQHKSGGWKNMAMVSESVLLTAVDRVERRQESRWINSRMGLNQEWNCTHPIYLTDFLFLRYPQFNNIRRYPRQRTTHREGEGVQISPVDPLSHTLIKMGVTTGII